MSGNSFFIVGVQRSGTTLLQALLERHPDVLMQQRAIGFRLVTCFNNFYDLMPHNLHLEPKEFQKWLIENDEKGRLAKLLDFENIEKHETIREFVHHSISKKLKENNKKIWGDKSPNLQHFSNEVSKFMPDAKMIHIIRDGRANAYSLSNRGYKNLRLSAQEWVDGNIYGLLNQDFLGKEKYKIIKYEYLLRQPEKEMKSVCEFLNIPFVPEMLDLADKNLEEEKKYVKSFFDVSKVDKWKTQLSPRELKKVEKIQGQLLEKLGYELALDLKSSDYRQLSLRRRIFLNQIDNFKLLFKRKRIGMKEKQKVEMNLSFRSRFKTFVTVFVRDFVSMRIFKSLFSKIFYREKIYKKDR